MIRKEEVLALLYEIDRLLQPPTILRGFVSIVVDSEPSEGPYQVRSCFGSFSLGQIDLARSREALPGPLAPTI